MPGPKVDGAALCKGEAVGRREMGEGPFGDSDASVEACRDRDLSEWGGMGLLEAKIFGSAHLRCAQGSCRTRRGAADRLRLRYARGRAPAHLAAPILQQLKSRAHKPNHALPRPRTLSYGSRLPGPPDRCSARAFQRRQRGTELNVLIACWLPTAARDPPCTRAPPSRDRARPIGVVLPSPRPPVLIYRS